MAFLDVDDILTDPDFADTLVCERNSQAVGNDGLAVLVTRKQSFTGIVTSNSGDILDRLTGGERIRGSITVHTAYRLQDGSSGYTADIIEWRCKRYTVSQVNDYSHFGRGFVAANCDLIPLAG